MRVEPRLARLEGQWARVTEAAGSPPVDTPEAFAARWVTAVNTILATMPAEYARPVLAELMQPTLTWDDLLAGHGLSPLAPLSHRVAAMAKRHAYQATVFCPRPYAGPLCIPAAVCALLVDLPPDAVQFTSYACAACGLEIPYRSPVGYLATCPYCGGTALGWPPLPEADP